MAIGKGKTTSTELANYDGQLAALAQMGQKTAKNVAGSIGKFIGTSGANFWIDGVKSKEKTIEFLIPDFILENAWYPGKYDPENKTPPDCFAFGREEADMVPHEVATNPQGTPYEDPDEAEQFLTDKDNIAEGVTRNCHHCWANQWKSGENGKGKACKNQVRLGLITVDSVDSAEDVKSADVKFLKVPVMSGKAWAAHVDNVADTLEAPMLIVTTRITIETMDNGGFELLFEAGEKIDPNASPEAHAIVGALISKHEKVAESIDFPYEPKAEEPAPAKGKAAGRFSKPAAPAAGRGKAMTLPAVAGGGSRKAKY